MKESRERGSIIAERWIIEKGREIAAGGEKERGERRENQAFIIPSYILPY